MSTKRVVRRAAAEDEFRRAVSYYQDEGGRELAHHFTDAVKATYRHIAQYPSAGSPRYDFEFGFEGLRARLVRGFPYIVFYVEGPDEIEVWRVLHAERDLLAELDDVAADGER